MQGHVPQTESSQNELKGMPEELYIQTGYACPPKTLPTWDSSLKTEQNMHRGNL